jgi:hypothetical protein
MTGSTPSRFSPARRTFTIRLRGTIWDVVDDRGDAGGVFATLQAAIRFARGECAGEPSARLVIVGAAAAARAA